MTHVILFNKPYNVLSQFTDPHGRETLKNYIQHSNVYAAGRLDRDSEGLLLLTNDGKLQQHITNPNNKISKSYWVQVEGIPSDTALKKLCEGIMLKDGLTQPAKAKRIVSPWLLWPRTPPIRLRQSIPDCWLEITIKEGKNRQIRRMTAAINHPTLRLIRYRIGSWTIDGLETGQYRIQNLPKK